MKIDWGALEEAGVGAWGWLLGWFLVIPVICLMAIRGGLDPVVVLMLGLPAEVLMVRFWLRAFELVAKDD